MQMEDYLYQKDLYNPLSEKVNKPSSMIDVEWDFLDRKLLGMIRLSLASSVLFNVSKEKTTKDLMDALGKLYEKLSASYKIFLMKNLFNMKMSENSSVADHLNDFNTVVNMLASVTIEFDEEVRALLILCSLPESWNSLVMVVSNSVPANSKLKFEDVVGVILSEEMWRKRSGESSTSGNALTVETRGRQKNRGNRGKSKDRERSKSKNKIVCWNCGNPGHAKKDCWELRDKKKQQEENKEENVEMGNVCQDALILSLHNITESWVLDSGASFHASPHRHYFVDYVQGDFGHVFLRDDEPCNIVGKGSV
ncbi:hypothetical protein KI387_044110 [Taxus chinensis]|uniref:CCHC-type domain-containing protein n=1 Tax=Taxus chinensis TaxID=29808 RepID=A0AA38CLE5_TAXCH|nr:hypothetical protein KI387_044110 [Taxus chinensis]